VGRQYPYHQMETVLRLVHQIMVRTDESGHVRIYEYSGIDWIQLGSDIDGKAAEDLSGSSVSLSSDGTRIAIGAPYNNGNRADSGHVRIYEYRGTDWVQWEET
jgi:hypothetical protein